MTANTVTSNNFFNTAGNLNGGKTISFNVPKIKVPSIFNSENAKNVYNSVNKEFASTNFETVTKAGGSKLSSSPIGQSLSGNLLDKAPVQNIFSKVFGTEIKAAGSVMKISSKSLTSEMEIAFRAAGMNDKGINLLKSGKEVKMYGQNLNSYVEKLGEKGAVENLVKNSGTKIQQVEKFAIQTGDSAFAAKYATKAMNVVGGVSNKVLKKEISEEFIEQSGKTAGRLAGKYGAKAAFVAKKTPVIGALIMGALQLPAIYSAFKNEGLGGGLKQVVRSGIRVGAGLAVGAVGAVIGGAVGTLCGPVVCTTIGAVIGEGVGYAVGDWIGEKVGNLLLGEPNTSGVDSKTDAEALDSSVATDYMLDLEGSYLTSALPTM